MKKLVFLLVVCSFLYSYIEQPSYAINEAPSAAAKAKQPAPNAKTIELAFVFDGKSDKNDEVLIIFQKTITRSLLPDYKASFPKELIFTGDWTNQGAINASNKALDS